jgi:hypothetical protein
LGLSFCFGFFVSLRWLLLPLPMVSSFSACLVPRFDAFLSRFRVTARRRRQLNYMVDAAHVVARLEELRGWSDYILDSLIADQPFEHGKLAILEKRAGGQALKEARELASALTAKLHNLAILVELTPEGGTNHERVILDHSLR